MSRVAAVVAIVLLVLLGSAGIGSAAPPAQQAPPSPVRLDLDSMSPRIVTRGGPGELVLSGSVTNTGTVPVDGLGIRVQRGERLDSEAALRDALDGEAGVDDVTPTFTPFGSLAPGTTMPFRYSIPLTGDPTTTLGLDRPGTYPLLVNVNGAPGGVRSRLAAARLTLPVSGLPGTSPEPGVAAPFTLLYPIAEPPHRVPPIPGAGAVLTDDDLATSFAPGGRLRGLVDALAQQAPVGSSVRAATCVAVDPELVATANAMRGGYQVAGVNGALRPGRGADAAGRWLDELTATVRGGCVLALPRSDADLVALVRGGQADLAREAVEQGRQSLAADLGGAPVLPGTVWPADGVLDGPTLQALPDASTLVLSATGLDQPDGARAPGPATVDGPGGPVRTLVTDPLLADAAGGDASPGAGRAPGPEVLSGGTGPLAAQDLVGALTYRATTDPDGRPVVLAPPHQWEANGGAGSVLLSAAAALIDEGRLTPAGLPALAAAPLATGAAAGLVYPAQAAAAEVPPSAVSVVSDQLRVLSDLQSAAEARTGVGARPEDVFGALRTGTLRGVSGAWRGRPDEADRNAAAVAGRIDDLRGTVRVLEPPSPYSLGTSDAPLLLTVANGLPVTMNVRVVLSSPPGLVVEPIGEQAVPPLGRVQIRVSAKVTRAGPFIVDAGLRTPSGAELGPDTRLRVRSTVYGTVTVWLTGIAGAVLVVLVARRMVRRIRPGGRRTTPDPSPDPSPRSAPESPSESTSESPPRPVPERPFRGAGPGAARPDRPPDDRAAPMAGAESATVPTRVPSATRPDAGPRPPSRTRMPQRGPSGGPVDPSRRRW